MTSLNSPVTFDCSGVTPLNAPLVFCPVETGTGTGTGPAARLTPLNLMLVTMRLPDEPAEDPEPEPADPGIVPPDIGEFWPEQGGWLGAYISLTENGVPTHALIVADKSTEFNVAFGGSSTPLYLSMIDGPGNFAAMLSDGRGSAVALNTNLNTPAHGGFSDWYLPASAELIILYFNLKPGTSTNGQGQSLTNATANNPWYVPSRSGNFSTTDPAQTSVAVFQEGGGQDFLQGFYRSSTMTASSQPDIVNFNTSTVSRDDLTLERRLRPIRRVPVTWEVP